MEIKQARALSLCADRETRQPRPSLIRALLGVWLLSSMVHLVAPSPGTAQEGERVIARVDGRAVLRVGPAAAMDAGARARQIERRLGHLLESPRAIGPPASSVAIPRMPLQTI